MFINHLLIFLFNYKHRAFHFKANEDFTSHLMCQYKFCHDIFSMFTLLFAKYDLITKIAGTRLLFKQSCACAMIKLKNIDEYSLNIVDNHSEYLP